MHKSLTTLALAATLLVGCGTSSEADSAYCKDFDAKQAQFQALATGDFSQLDGAVTSMHELADQAPSSLTEEWKAVEDNMTQISDAMDKAGVSFAEAEAMRQGAPAPENVDPAAMQQLALDLAAIDPAAMIKASNAIDKHAREECGLTLARG